MNHVSQLEQGRRRTLTFLRQANPCSFGVKQREQNSNEGDENNQGGGFGGDSVVPETIRRSLKEQGLRAVKKGEETEAVERAPKEPDCTRFRKHGL